MKKNLDKNLGLGKFMSDLEIIFDKNNIDPNLRNRIFDTIQEDNKVKKTARDKISCKTVCDYIMALVVVTFMGGITILILFQEFRQFFDLYSSLIE